MKLPSVSLLHLLGGAGFLVLLSVGFVEGQQLPSSPRQFTPGILGRIEELPESRLRTRLERLPETARQRALARLRSFHFTELDMESLEPDADGEMFYVDHFTPDPVEVNEPEEPIIAAAAVPVSPFPASLIFHSRPGAPNTLYLNFTGENVSGTSWNSGGRTTIPAVAFSTDSDFSNFSDAEQTTIKRVWQRVAEDFAPFNIDVTTERPATFGTRTAHALITRSTDANGVGNPSSSAGGVAYVNVFGNSNYGNYRPGWVYFDNLGSGSASSIAEAVSHEIGHNLGLSHDGKTDGADYYSGHGSGNTSWGPIMGSVTSRNVTQWSKGEYHLANNTQDDLATIAAKISYRMDDRGDTPAVATALVFAGGTNVVSTTPENDPANSNPANKGVLERNTDVDVFSFTTAGGAINLTISPWITPSGSRGGNLDIVAELRDSTGALVLSNNPTSQTTAQLQTTLVAGTYYLHVCNTGTGDPQSSTPTGYTSYGSIGQYFISGSITGIGTPSVRLTATANNSAWGAVNPTNATYAAGSAVQVVATPASYYRFVRWTNGATGTSNPLTLVLNTNTSIQAVFAETLTVSHPTPHWWLASHGYTINFEAAVNATGANGIPLWQSYIAGLNPNDPNSRVRLAITRSTGGAPNVLGWTPVAGRVYTLWYTTNAALGFTRVPNASNLPSTVSTFSHTLNPPPRAVFYRVEVGKL
jgi:hypothetical protein